MKIKTLSLFLSVMCLGARPGEVLAQTTFYVDATLGRDTYNGTTPDVDDTLQQGPWKSIARVHAQALAPGDEILFKRGEIWRELLSFSSSGSAGQPITLGAYASGAPPIISGADAVSRWTVSDPARGLYRANVTTEPAVLFVGAARGRRRASIGQLARAHDWCWAAGILSVRTPAAPGATVEAGVRGTAVAILGQSYITVQDVMLERTNGSGLYVDTATRATSNIIVQRVTARASRYAGIAFKNGHPTFETTAVLLSENTVYENGASGINISEGVSDVTITRNVSHHNNWSGDIYEAGIRVWADRRTARNLVIEHNETYGMYFTGTGWQNGHGIWIDEVADGAVVRYNYSHDNGNIGIFVEHSHRAQVYYNVLVNNRDASIMLYRGVDRNEVYNNTIYGGGTGIRLAGDGQADSVTGNLIKNNISAGPTGQRLMAGDGGENDGTKGSGNVYLYNSFGAERSGFITWGYGVSKSTYTDWETAYGSATQSMRADPRFAGPADFRLATTSPCLGAGVELGLVMDILGAPVPSGVPPDQGAYQGAAASVVRFGRAGSAGQTPVDAQRVGGNSRPGVAPLHLLVAGLPHRDRQRRILQEP